MRCRASQRRYRNTLLFAAPDEALLATAREAVRKALAWESIVKDDRLQQQLTQGQAANAKEKAKNHRGGAETAVRLAWSHILFPVKTDSTAAGSAFDLDHLSVMDRDRGAIPTAVYDKAKNDGVVTYMRAKASHAAISGPLRGVIRKHNAIKCVCPNTCKMLCRIAFPDHTILWRPVADSEGVLA